MAAAADGAEIHAEGPDDDGVGVGDRKEPLFEAFYLFKLPPIGLLNPQLSFRFPPKVVDEDARQKDKDRDAHALQTLAKLCFPYDDKSTAGFTSQNFTFYFLGGQSYGFCRQNEPRTPASDGECLCLITKYPWHGLFTNLLSWLNNIHLTTKAKDKLPEMLESLHAMNPRHLWGQQLSVANNVPGPQIKPFVAKVPSKVPTLQRIDSNPNIEILCKTLSTTNILTLFASTLFDRRILITSASLQRISGSVYGVIDLMYPLTWEHTLIPIMSKDLLDYCTAPMPYIMGVHASLIEAVQREPLEAHVLVNIDTDTVTTPHEDYQQVPLEWLAPIRLAVNKARAGETKGTELASAFVGFFVNILGDYQDFLEETDALPMTKKFAAGWRLAREDFVQSKPKACQSFVQSLFGMQGVTQFIDARIDALHRGEDEDDNEVFNAAVNEKAEKRDKIAAAVSSIRKPFFSSREKHPDVTSQQPRAMSNGIDSEAAARHKRKESPAAWRMSLPPTSVPATGSDGDHAHAGGEGTPPHRLSIFARVRSKGTSGRQRPVTVGGSDDAPVAPPRRKKSTRARSPAQNVPPPVAGGTKCSGGSRGGAEQNTTSAPPRRPPPPTTHTVVGVANATVPPLRPSPPKTDTDPAKPPNNGTEAGSAPNNSSSPGDTTRTLPVPSTSTSERCHSNPFARDESATLTENAQQSSDPNVHVRTTRNPFDDVGAAAGSPTDAPMDTATVPHNQGTSSQTPDHATPTHVTIAETGTATPPRLNPFDTESSGVQYSTRVFCSPKPAAVQTSSPRVNPFDDDNDAYADNSHDETGSLARGSPNTNCNADVGPEDGGKLDGSDGAVGNSDGAVLHSASGGNEAVVQDTATPPLRQEPQVVVAHAMVPPTKKVPPLPAPKTTSQPPAFHVPAAAVGSEEDSVESMPAEATATVATLKRPATAPQTLPKPKKHPAASGSATADTRPRNPFDNEETVDTA